MEEFSRQNILDKERRNQQSLSQVEFFFNPPLSDFDIIELQNLLMTPAVHHVKTQNIETGRFLMKTFLDSLKHYHHVGCFTFTQKNSLSKNVFNFLHLNRKQNVGEFVENFFIENPQVDFAWVESTSEFKNRISKQELHNLCEVLTAHGQTPVVVMNYSETI